MCVERTCIVGNKRLNLLETVPRMKKQELLRDDEEVRSLIFSLSTVYCSKLVSCNCRKLRQDFRDIRHSEGCRGMPFFSSDL